MASATNNS